MAIAAKRSSRHGIHPRLPHLDPKRRAQSFFAGGIAADRHERARLSEDP